MVQTRSQTKKQEVEVEGSWFKHEEEEVEEAEACCIKKDGVWNLLYDTNGNYSVVTDNYYYTEGGDNYHEFKAKDYVVTDNCYTEEGDNYHEFKAEDYDGGEPTAYRQAVKHYYTKVVGYILLDSGSII